MTPLKKIENLLKMLSEFGVTEYSGPACITEDSGPTVKISLTKCQKCATNKIIANAASSLTSDESEYRSLLLHSTGLVDDDAE